MSASTSSTWDFVSSTWDSTIIPTLCEYIKVPNVSPLFDPNWATNGNQDKAVELIVNWVKKQNVKGLELEVVRLEKRTPVIFMTVPSTKPDWQETVLLYGHLDKQPPLNLSSWEPGLGPYTPVIKDGKLYGRGGADDGYSTFAAITSIKALQEQNIPHARCVIIIEACEESGSFDLPAYIEHLQPRIGVPSLIICLDSGCGNYEQFWITTSLRGMIAGDLKVHVLKEGSHSGHASGIVPSSFRIIRQLLSRLEDEKTGVILPKDFYVSVPEHRIAQAKSCAEALGNHIYEEFQFADKTQPVTYDVAQLILNRTWNPQLAVTGADGLPSLTEAGNVLRTHTSLKLSLRIPPTLDPIQARDALKRILEEHPPYNAKVEFDAQKASTGWESPALESWLETALHKASNQFYNKPANFVGEGGSIPFMGMLGKKFPKAQFVITGVLGPASNAHGPNEMLHIDMGKKVTACVTSILADHYAHFSKNS